MPTTVQRLWDQLSGGPGEVLDQSRFRKSAPSSPSAERKGRCPEVVRFLDAFPILHSLSDSDAAALCRRVPAVRIGFETPDKIIGFQL